MVYTFYGLQIYNYLKINYLIYLHPKKTVYSVNHKYMEFPHSRSASGRN